MLLCLTLQRNILGGKNGIVSRLFAARLPGSRIFFVEEDLYALVKGSNELKTWALVHDCSSDNGINSPSSAYFDQWWKYDSDRDKLFEGCEGGLITFKNIFSNQLGQMTNKLVRMDLTCYLLLCFIDSYLSPIPPSLTD